MDMKSRVPHGVRQAVKSGVRAYTIRTGALRMLPDYLIIGASQRNILARLLGGSAVRSVAQQLPDSIQLLICG